MKSQPARRPAPAEQDGDKLARGRGRCSVAFVTEGGAASFIGGGAASIARNAGLLVTICGATSQPLFIQITCCPFQGFSGRTGIRLECRGLPRRLHPEGVVKALAVVEARHEHE